jgi:hypothetical protein
MIKIGGPGNWPVERTPELLHDHSPAANRGNSGPAYDPERPVVSCPWLRGSRRLRDAAARWCIVSGDKAIRWSTVAVVAAVAAVAAPVGGEFSAGGGQRLPSGPEMTEVGVLEVVVVLQAVAEEAVKADVGEPDQADGDDKGFALPPAEPDHRCRKEGAVGEVVQPRPEAAAAKVADHEHVGDEKGKRDEPPGR